MYKSFVEMPVWQNAIKLAKEVFDLTIDFTKSEDYGLTSQIRRSPNGIAANISEGFGRNSSKDKNHYYTMARGSAFETQSHLIYGNQFGYFNENVSNVLINKYNELIFELNRLMKKIRG